MRPEETTVHGTEWPSYFYKLGSCERYHLVAKQFGIHRSTVILYGCVYSMFSRNMLDKAMSQEVHHMAKATPAQVVDNCQKPG